MIKTTIRNLKINEEISRDLYLRKLSLGTIQGQLTGKASIDKPWLKYYREEKIKSVLPKMTMYDYLYLCNKDHLSSIAIEYYGRRISYKKMFDEIEKTQKAFQALGVKDGDIVSLATPYLPETVYAIYALNKIGAIANMVDPRVPSEKLKNYINKSNSTYLVMINLCYQKVNNIYEDTNLKKVISVSPMNSLPCGLNFFGKIKENALSVNNVETLITKDNKFIKWNQFIQKGHEVLQSIDGHYRENKPSVIVYTSGTSGEPKGAKSSNESFNNMAFLQSDSIVNTERSDKFLLIMPPFISYGLAIGLHGQLCAGQTLIMEPKFNIDNSASLLGNLVKKYKPQTIMGVPNFMVDLVKHPKMQKLDCSFLKNLIVGGDSMNPASEEIVNEFMKQHKSEAVITKGWGLTEVNSCSTYTRDKYSNPIGSVGIPLFKNNIKIVKPLPENIENIDIDCVEELNYDELGEIFITSPTVIVDYLENEEESRRVFFKSKETEKIWVRTMDLGYITKDGLLYIQGRMKRIIIRPDGHNISPFAIENIINKNEKVEQSAVISRTSEEYDHGSYAIAYVQLKEQYKELTNIVYDEIKEAVDSKLPPRDVASDYVFIDEIPLTNIGKVDYKKLESLENKTKVKTLK